MHLFKKDNSKLTVATLFIAIASFALGMILSIIFAFVRVTNNFVDPTGYIVGGVLIVAGLTWYFIGARKNQQQVQPAQPAKTTQPS
jgi:ABC-type amino acid transport system permease subunit